MEKRDPETGVVELRDEIECIHTAVMEIPVAEFEETVNNPHFEEEVMRIRSTENLKEIHLETGEKFKAFKSWIAGIAEAGLDAFKIQAMIEDNGGFMYAVSWRLMRFLAKVDSEIMLEYLYKIERECIHEGERHESCLMANLIPILDMIMMDAGRFMTESFTDNLLQLETQEMDKYTEIITAIFEMQPPLKLFMHDLKYSIFLRYPQAADIPDFETLFRHDNPHIKKVLILNPRVTEFDEFRDFFYATHEPDAKVRAMAAKHPESTEYDEFRNFLSIRTENSTAVRCIAADHPGATNFSEYKNLLSVTTEPRSKVRKVAAKNEEAADLVEYANFLSYITEPDPKVRAIAATNQNAQKLPQFRNLLSDETEINTLVKITAIRNWKLTHDKDN